MRENHTNQDIIPPPITDYESGLGGVLSRYMYSMPKNDILKQVEVMNYCIGHFKDLPQYVLRYWERPRNDVYVALKKYTQKVANTALKY